jgi:hypothetical protein
MHTLGSTFIPPGIHAGGLRYHGMAPLVSHVLDLGLAEATTVQQLDAFAAGIQFARAEGIIPAPEANHAVAEAIREALQAKKEGKQRTILFNLSGHGHFDMQSTSPIRPGSWRTTSIRKKRSRWRWPACRRFTKPPPTGWPWTIFPPWAPSPSASVSFATATASPEQA